MPEWKFRVVRAVIEFAVDGSLSDGAVIDAAMYGIRNLKEVTIIPPDEDTPWLYVKPPRVKSVTIEDRH